MYLRLLRFDTYGGTDDACSRFNNCSAPSSDSILCWIDVPQAGMSSPGNDASRFSSRFSRTVANIFLQGFTIFHERLQQYITERNNNVSAQTQWIQHQYSTLRDSFPEWENEALALSQLNSRPLLFLEQVHTCWDATTDYFLALANPPKGQPSLQYLDLVSSHIRHAVNYWGDAWRNIRESKTRGPPDPFGWVAEGAHCYWDYLPDIVADMRAAGFGGADELVYEAWFSLMFRAFCWWRCHYMVEVWSEGGRMEPGVEISRLPARFWRSEMPVYIG